MINVQIKGGNLGRSFSAGALVLGQLQDKMAEGATKTILGKSRVYITESKAIDTGFLRGPAMREDRLSPGKRRLENTAPYSLFIHEGTRKMRKRPFFDEGIRRSKSDIKRLIEKAMDLTLTTIVNS